MPNADFDFLIPFAFDFQHSHEIALNSFKSRYPLCVIMSYTSTDYTTGAFSLKIEYVTGMDTLHRQ